jgi:ketosteroid isomerase-like protein
MTTRQELLDLAARYFRALEESDRPALEALLDERIRMETLPNRIAPSGAVTDGAGMLADFDKGKQAVRTQTYSIESAVVEGDRVALQVLWTATVGRAIGSLKPGDTMRAHFAVFLDFRDGRIVSQRNYDCFDPF